MTKQILLRFFRTSTQNVVETGSSIYNQLKVRLDGSRIESRIIKVHPSNDNSDEDVLSFYAIIPDDYMFGMLMRVSSKKSIKAVPVDFGNLENLKFTELQEVEDENHEKYCINHYYFMLKGNYLVTNIPKTMTISRFQDYVNRLLNQDEKYSYVPMLNTEGIAMNDVAKIVVRDHTIHGQENGEIGKSLSSKLKSARNFTLKKLFPTIPSLKSIDKKNIFSVELTIKASRPKKMAIDDYNRQLSALLQPVADAKNVMIYTKKGIITGDQLALTHTVEVEEENFENNLMNVMKQELSTY